MRLTRTLSEPLLAPDFPNGVRFAPSRDVDPPAMHRLLQAAYVTGHGSVPPNAAEWWKGTSTDSEFDPHLLIVAVGESGMPVGLALCWTSSFVKDLVVHPDWQGRGIGTALLAEAMRRLATHGAHEVALKVRPANVGARRLYARVGFRDERGQLP